MSNAPNKAPPLASYASPPEGSKPNMKEKAVTTYHPNSVDPENTDKSYTTLKQLQGSQSMNPFAQMFSKFPSSCDLTSYSNMVAASISLLVVLLILKLTKALPISSQGVRIQDLNGRTVLLAAILGSLIFVISKKYIH